MERDWLEKFYTECGREVTLAYNVLNNTNTWGVTLFVAILASGFLGAIRLHDTSLRFVYPNIYHWIFIAVGWVIMLRFFVRSALAYSNMIRWNNLIFATAKVLSLPKNHRALPILEENLAAKIDLYYFQWRSAISYKKLIYANLTLMYLWPFILIIALFIWGAICLEKNIAFFIGLGVFVFPTVLEAYWFFNWYGLKYAKPELQDEPNIIESWSVKPTEHEEHTFDKLILGFCLDGPFKFAQSILSNPQIKWTPWYYHIFNVSSDIQQFLKKGILPHDIKVVFACWKSDFTGKVHGIRRGKIDHYSLDQDSIRFTVKLDDISDDLPKEEITVKNPKILCFMK